MQNTNLPHNCHNVAHRKKEKYAWLKLKKIDSRHHWDKDYLCCSILRGSDTSWCVISLTPCHARGMIYLKWRFKQIQLLPCNVSTHYINGNESGAISLYHPHARIWFTVSLHSFPESDFLLRWKFHLRRLFACLQFTNSHIQRYLLLTMGQHCEGV